MVLQKLKKIFEPISMIMIIIGIIGLIQPIGIGIFRLGFLGRPCCLHSLLPLSRFLNMDSHTDVNNHENKGGDAGNWYVIQECAVKN